MPYFWMRWSVGVAREVSLVARWKWLDLAAGVLHYGALSHQYGIGCLFFHGGKGFYVVGVQTKLASG